MLHSFLHKHELSVTINGSRLMSVDRRWVGDTCAPGLAEPYHHKCSSFWQCKFCTETYNHSCSISEAPGCWQYGLSQLKSVPSVGYLTGPQTKHVTSIVLVSQEFSERQSEIATWQWLLSRRCGFNLGCIPLKHAQQPHHKYALSKLAGNVTIHFEVQCMLAYQIVVIDHSNKHYPNQTWKG